MQINRANMIIPPVGNRDVAQANTPQAQPKEGANFAQFMDNAINARQLQFSKHASVRLSDRNIQLTGSQLARIEEGVTRAGDKGIRDSLVLIDNIALVVNIANKVVVTALNQQDQVFTNIDGAVIV
jgi:flagellar operon protein